MRLDDRATHEVTAPTWESFENLLHSWREFPGSCPRRTGWSHEREERSTGGRAPAIAPRPEGRRRATGRSAPAFAATPEGRWRSNGRRTPAFWRRELRRSSLSLECGRTAGAVPGGAARPRRDLASRHIARGPPPCGDGEPGHHPPSRSGERIVRPGRGRHGGLRDRHGTCRPTAGTPRRPCRPPASACGRKRSQHRRTGHDGSRARRRLRAAAGGRRRDRRQRATGGTGRAFSVARPRTGRHASEPLCDRLDSPGGDVHGRADPRRDHRVLRQCVGGTDVLWRAGFRGDRWRDESFCDRPPEKESLERLTTHTDRLGALVDARDDHARVLAAIAIVQISVVAFAGRHHAAHQSGFLLAVWSGGSMAGGLLLGARTARAGARGWRR